MKISTILDQIDLGSMALPEFQRGYVWNRDQVRGLMHSLYRRHPVGGLLVWVTKAEGANVRGDTGLPPGTVKLLLDGQQRMTSLYGIVRGKPPEFFDGNHWAFTDLYFNLADEAFSFYMPQKMKDDPMWIDVTALMREGVGTFIQRIMEIPEMQADMSTWINRLNAVEGIKEIDLHIEEVTGDDKTVDIVVDIFNRVNSGGTKLSKGDLALAKICAEWPDARAEMKTRLEKWRAADIHFRLELLLRCINTIVTGEALFSALDNVDAAAFRDGLKKAERAVDSILNLIASRLGLDHDRVLGSRYSFPLMARYLDQCGGRLSDPKERDKLIYWYVHTFLWGRYAVSTESTLNRDLALVEDPEGALDRLVVELRQNRGDLRIMADDFMGWSRGARFYPLLYMMTRVCHARDWDTGVELSAGLLGRHTSLHVHHIFPKALLYKNGYARPDVNAIANFTFLTEETNIRVSDRDPAEYLAEFAAKDPDALKSHWIPMDTELWKIENYHDFLAARRDLLAQSANEFLDSLLAGAAPEPVEIPPVTEREVAPVPGGIGGPEEEEALVEVNEWIVQNSLPEGEMSFELADAETGEPLAVLDLAWPDGLQVGLSQPVALLLDEGKETEEAANRAGYRYFTDVDAFRGYVLKEILALEAAE